MTKIIQITDPHLGPDAEFRLAGVQTGASFEAILREASSLSPDLFVVTGDIAANPDPAAYQQFFRAMNDTGIPMIWLPGNHDVIEVAESVGNAVPYCKSYDISNWRILMMDSVVPNSPNGQFGEAELALLEQLLAENTQDYAMVCVHHHPMQVGSTWLDRQCISDAEDFLQIISADSRIRSVHWGHIHQAFEQTIDSVLYASAPSTCMQFKPASENFALDDQRPGFRVIDLSTSGAISTEVRRVEVPGFQVALDSKGY